MNILGIETSCDDTGVAVVEANADGSFRIHSNVITTQDHTKTGGVVPEVAARHHANSILPCIDNALQQAAVSIGDIDAIAVTRGPGLIPCLLVGVEAAKTLSVALGIPIVGVNHMEAHIASTFVEHPKIAFPAIALLASGGHTMLVGIPEAGHYFLIGRTRDDAAGEAFDKVAKMLGLPYPGGPHISHIAEQGDPMKYDFPKPMLHADEFDFSFAGLKTAVLYHIRDHQPLSEQDTADIAASFQESVLEVLIGKTIKAAMTHEARTIILGGGVSANIQLQQRLRHVAEVELPETTVVIPSPGLFTDNGAMIAVAGAPRVLKGDFDDWQHVVVDPHLRIA